MTVLIRALASRGLTGAAPSVTTVRTVLVGDSLTDKRFDLNRNLHPFWWQNGLNGRGAMKLIFNAGVNGDTVGNMLSRIDNAYTASPPGLSGLSNIDEVQFRGGTNDARNLTAAATLATTYTSLFSKLAGYARQVVLLPVPPIGSTEANFAAKNALTIEYNTWLQQFAADNPSVFTFVNDCVSVRNGDGTIIAQYFDADGVHTSNAGITQQGVDGSLARSVYFRERGYSSPLSTSAADVYPTTQQLVTNHLMAGTSGTAGSGITGSVANGFTIAGTAGAATATVSKVAADAGDANQTPWQRIAPTQTTSGQQIRLSTPLAISSLAATSNPLEMMYEVRLNALDSTKISVLRAYVTTSSGDVTDYMDLKMGGGALTYTLTVRQAYPRSNGGAFNTPTLRVDALCAASFTGSMGSFDIRNVTVRQE